MSANALPPLSPLPTTPATRESKNVAAQRYLQKIKPPPLKSPTKKTGSKAKAIDEDSRSVSSRRSRRSSGSRKSSRKPSSARSLQPDAAESAQKLSNVNGKEDRNDHNDDDDDEEEELHLDWAAAVGMPSPTKSTPRRGKKKPTNRPSEDRAAAALALCRGDGLAKKKKSSKKRSKDDDAMSLSIPKSIFGQQQPQRREKDDCDASFSTLGTVESSTKLPVDPRNGEEDALSATRSNRNNKKVGATKISTAAPASAGIVSQRKQELDAAIERKGIGELYEEELKDKSGHRRSLSANRLNTMGSLSRRGSRRSILELPFAADNNANANNDPKSPTPTATQQKVVLDPPAHIPSIEPTTSSSEHSRRYLSKSPSRRRSLSSSRVRRKSLDGTSSSSYNPAVQLLQKRIQMLEEELMDQRREQKQLTTKYKNQHETTLQAEVTALKRAHLQELDRRAIAYINETKLLENRLRSAQNDLQTQSNVHQEKIQLLQEQLSQEQFKFEQAQQGHAEALGKMQSAKDELESNMEKLAAKQQSSANKLKTLHSQELQKVLEMNGELVQALQAKLKQQKLDAQAKLDQDAENWKQEKESMQLQHEAQLQDQLAKTEASHQKALKSLQDRLETEHEIAIENMQDEHKHAIAESATSQSTEMQNAHAVEMESLRETLQQEYSERFRSELEINRETQQQKHADEIAALRDDHEMKLQSYKVKEEQRRTEEQASHDLERLQQIEEIQTQHKEQMETLLRDLLEEHEEHLKCTLDKQKETLTLLEEKHQGQVGKMEQELDEVTKKAAIVQQEYDVLKSELQDGRSSEEVKIQRQIEKHNEIVQQLHEAHAEEIVSLRSQLDTLTLERSQKVESLQRDHDQRLETLKNEEHDKLKLLHSNELENLEVELDEMRAKTKLDEESYEQRLQELRSEFDQAMLELSKKHQLASVSLQDTLEENGQQKEALEALEQELEALKHQQTIALELKNQEHDEQIQQLRDQLEHVRSELQKTHLDLEQREESLKEDLNAKQKEALQALDLELETLKQEHAATLKSKRQEHDAHIQELQTQLQQYQQEQGANDERENELAALGLELEELRKQQAATLHSQQAEHKEEVERLQAQLENLQAESDRVRLDLQETLEKQRCDMQSEQKEALEALLQELEASKAAQTVALQSKQESHDEQLQLLQDQLNEARLAAESKLETSENMDILRQEKNEQIESLQKQFEEQQKQNENQLEKLSNERDQKVTFLEQKLESLQSEQQGVLVEKEEEHSKQIELLEKELQRARDELIDIKLQSESDSKNYMESIQDVHRKKLSSLQKDLDSHRAEKENLQSQLEERMLELSTEKDKASLRMQQLECQVEEYQEQICQLTASSTHDVEDLRQQLSEKEEQLQKYDADQAQVNKLHTEIETLKEERNKLAHSHDEEVKLLKEELELKEGLTSELRSELQKTSDERDTLNAAIESLKAELETLKQIVEKDVPLDKKHADETMVSSSDVPPVEKIHQLEDELLCIQEEQDETKAHLQKLISAMAELREENQKLKVAPVSIPKVEDPTKSDFVLAKQQVEGLETQLAIAKGHMAMLATEFESETGEYEDYQDEIFRTSSREPDRAGGGSGDNSLQTIGCDTSNYGSDGNKVEVSSSQDSYIQQAMVKQKQDRSWITILGRFGGPSLSSKNNESASSFESVENESYRSQLITMQSKYKDEVYELRQRIAQLEAEQVDMREEKKTS